MKVRFLQGVPTLDTLLSHHYISIMDEVDSLLSQLSLHEEYDKISNDEVERLRVESIDRWTWETGTEEDAVLIKKLERECRWRNHNRARIEKEAAEKSAEEKAMAIFSADLSAEIDRDIMRKIYEIVDKKED